MGEKDTSVSKQIRNSLENLDFSLPIIGGKYFADIKTRALIDLQWLDFCQDFTLQQLSPDKCDSSLTASDSAVLPLTVVIFGASGTGKSSLVNALVDDYVSAVSPLRPTTTEPVAVASALTWKITAHSDLFIGCQRATTDNLLPGIFLIDLPENIDEISIQKWLGRADICIFVTTAQRYGDRKAWEQFTAARAHDIPTVLVLNRFLSTQQIVRRDITSRLASFAEQNVKEIVLPLLSPARSEGTGHNSTFPPLVALEIRQEIWPQILKLHLAVSSNQDLCQLLGPKYATLSQLYSEIKKGAVHFWHLRNQILDESFARAASYVRRWEKALRQGQLFATAPEDKKAKKLPKSASNSPALVMAAQQFYLALHTSLVATVLAQTKEIGFEFGEQNFALWQKTFGSHVRAYSDWQIFWTQLPISVKNNLAAVLGAPDCKDSSLSVVNLRAEFLSCLQNNYLAILQDILRTMLTNYGATSPDYNGGGK